jgi:uncharacterized delta-60 repeat protein
MRIRLLLVLVTLFVALAPSIAFAASGDLDRSYGVNGLALIQDGNPTALLAIQADNKVIVAGQCAGPSGGRLHFCLTRYLTNGSLDLSFGVDGRVYTVIGVETSSLQKVVVLPDGKILAVGFTTRTDPTLWEPYFYEFAIVRYHPNGTLDTSLDGDGIVTNAIMGYRGAKGYDVAVQPDGKMVVAGVGTISNSYFVVARFNVNGSLDTSFDGDGIWANHWSGKGGAYGVALQSDGKILVAGTGGLNYEFVLARYRSDGNLDNSFNAGGHVKFTGEFEYQGYNVLRQVDVLANGKILVSGATYRYSQSYLSLNRFNPDGSFDTTFDENGQLMTRIVADSGTCDVGGVYVQPDGKMAVAAHCVISGIGRSSVRARYLLNGTLDQQFGNKGAVIDGPNNYVVAVAGQADGKLVFSATRANHLYLERYLNNGTRESDFDNDRIADVSVFRPSLGTWYLNKSTDGFSAIQFGAGTDRIAPGDFDGDGVIDVAVFRSGAWYILRSSDNAFVYTQFGQPGDVPVPADYDGDGRADIAVFRQGIWYIINSRDYTVRGEQFGQAGDRAVVGNFDGDLRADLAVYRNGIWYVNGSTAGFMSTQFGTATDRPVAADYDSDGRTDYAVYRDGTWYLLQSFTGFSSIQFGLATDRPAPADYDGDGRADAAVYRDGAWYILASTSGFQSVSFGTAEDVPVPSAFIP